MELWGVTGLIGSGKSQATKYLAGLGFPVVDADDTARRVLSREYLEKTLALKSELLALFGAALIHPSGELDRGFLRKCVAENPELRLKLENLTHPLIKKINRSIFEGTKKNVGFIEGTRLLESGSTSDFKGLILVTAPEKIRKERVKKRNPEKFSELWKLALSIDEKKLRAHSAIVWKNEGTLEDLYTQINHFLNERNLKSEK